MAKFIEGNLYWLNREDETWLAPMSGNFLFNTKNKFEYRAQFMFLKTEKTGRLSGDDCLFLGPDGKIYALYYDLAYHIFEA